MPRLPARAQRMRKLHKNKQGVLEPCILYIITTKGLSSSEEVSFSQITKEIFDTDFHLSGSSNHPSQHFLQRVIFSCVQIAQQTG